MKLPRKARVADPRAQLKALRDAAARRAEAAKAERGAAQHALADGLIPAPAPRTLRAGARADPSNPKKENTLALDIDPLETIEELQRGQRAEHKEHERLNGFVAVTVAILATFLGICNVKDDNVVQAMLAAQAEMIDQWNFYQARNIREEVMLASVEQLELAKRGRTDPAERRRLRRDASPTTRRWRRARTSRRKSRRRWPRTPRPATTSSTTRTTSSTWPRRRSRSPSRCSRSPR